MKNLKNLQVLKLVGLLFISLNVHGQESSVYSEIWFQYYNKLVFSNKWSLSTDTGYRLKEGEFNQQSQFFIRTGIGYSFNANNRLLLGAASFKTHLDWDISASEFRPHQEFTSNFKFGKVAFKNRFRSEQRFIDIEDPQSGNLIHSFNLRFRYRFLFYIPITKLSKLDPTKKLSFIIGNEILLSTGKNEFFDFGGQNRFLVGPAIYFNKNNALTLLYNHTSVTKDVPLISEEFGIIWLGYKQTIDFRK
ncbi:DUF2490 domain-containing protein [Flavicella marina]|uniref:DUF2490 domain-containing protein n=1 Tax=Flavicella marina TaxID=1475951 RepID=UPI00126474DA|nr:DUF2490 domain-containing protein [Flavicella marina]